MAKKTGCITEQLGILLTGFIVMWLVFIFMVHFQQFTVEILGGIMAVIFGGVVLYFVQLSDKKNIWNYPIGLFLGFIAFQFVLGSGMFSPLLLLSAGANPVSTITPVIPTTSVTPFPPQTTPIISPTAVPTPVPTTSAAMTPSMSVVDSRVIFFVILMVVGIGVTAWLYKRHEKQEQPPSDDS